MSDIKTLPIFKMVLSDSDDSGIKAIALVDEPAINMKWDVYNKESHKFQADTDKRIVSGAAMVAGMSIYRRHETYGEYNAVFDATTIRALVEKYFKEQRGNQVNRMHNSDDMVDGVYMIESFLIDRERGVNPPTGHEYMTDGSWFTSYKIDNDKVWNEDVKTGKFQGFSIEGLFEPVHQELKSQYDVIIKDLELIKQHYIK
tara:strand:+ start:188 stop:790 length:603 start_codon:yes stop_codon:yes gene_type:complete